MIIIGYDYGTTTSWLSVARNMELPQVTSMKSSLLIANNGNSLLFGDNAIQSKSHGTFIKSPKKFIVESNWDDFNIKYGFRLDDIIIRFTSLLLEQIQSPPIPQAGEDVHVTITIPNCYDGPRMRFMRDVMRRFFSQHYSDSNVIIHLLPEPIAAALHYAVSTNIPGGTIENRYIVTNDIGGGTTDLAVISLRREYVNSKYDFLFEVLATESDGNLGGDDIDDLLYKRYNSARTQSDGENVGIRLQLTQAKETLSYNNNPIIIADDISCIMTQELIVDILRDEILRDHETFYLKIESLSMKLKNVVSTKYRNKYNKDFQWSNVLLLPIGGTMKIPYLRKSFSLFFEGADICDLKTERNKTFEGVMSGALHYSGISSRAYTMFDMVKVEGRICHPISVEYLDHRLYPVVNENEPDGEYEIDKLRPLEVEDDCFSVSTINLFYMEGHTIDDKDIPDYQLAINRSFSANGRKAEDIPIKLKLIVKKSMLSRAIIRIEKINDNGENFEQVYDFECQ